MIYIGIDIASRKHDCCILNHNGDVLKQFSFSNDASGFDLFLQRVSECPDAHNAKVGLEATGVYGDALINFLKCNGFEVVTFNPLSVKKRLSANTLRKTKTDKADAKFLANLVSWKGFQPDRTVSYHTSELKSLSRARFHVVQNCSALKNKAKGILAVVFPEFINLFSDTFGSSAMAVLEKYPSAKDLKRCRKSTITNILLKVSRGRVGEEKAELLISAAKTSIGVYSLAKTLELQMLLEQIILYRKHIKRFDKEIKRVMEESGTTITTVKGIGYVLGAMILGEIGDINRFENPGKILAFAGLEASIYQSGNFTPASGKMVKRGSPYLRYAFMQAARCVAFFNPVFSEYMEKKRSEGKSYTVATSHVAKKLVRVLFAIIRNNSVYSSNYSLFAA